MSKQLVNLRESVSRQSTGLERTQAIYNKLAGELSTLGSASELASVSKAVYSSEGLSQANGQTAAFESISSKLQSAITSVEQNLSGLETTLSKTPGFKTSQRLAAVESLFQVTNVRDTLARGFVKQAMPTGQNIINQEAPGTLIADAMQKRVVGVENFDERDNRNAVVTTVTYNLSITKQNDFGEAFYQTTVIPADHWGLAASIRLNIVQEDVRRSTDGTAAAFQRRNIVRALIDDSILKGEQTRVVPVYTAQSAANFSTEVSDYDFDLEGEIIRTAPLAFKKRIGDVIGLSQTAALIQTGAMGQDDTLDPVVILDKVYAKFGDDVVVLNVKNFARSSFIATSDSETRTQNLNFETTSYKLTANTLQFGGAALDDLAVIRTKNLAVQIGLRVSGQVQVATGELSAYPLEITLQGVTDQDGNKLPATDADVVVLKALIEGDVDDILVGYDIYANRANLNRRQRGQLIDTIVYNQVWGVPLRSPVTVARVVNSPSDTDAADLNALIVTSFVRISNDAVKNLHETVATLGDYAASSNVSNTVLSPELFGPARFLVEPTFKARVLNLFNVVNNRTSSQIREDVSGLLTANLTEMAYAMYRDSGFQALVESGALGVSGNPTIIFGTDPYTAQYLMQQGEPRTFGPDFKTTVVMTPNKRQEGHIAIAFGYPELNNGQYNPAHFGSLIWAPELTLNLPMQRQGGVQKELVVQPRYRHVVNVPVLGWLTVEGLPEVFTQRLPIAYQEV